jgi:citrate lyase subunit beta / citryl-CoA lyase
MTPEWPLRAFLFVPAHRPTWVAKAIRAGTDAVVLDLEDSVPPEHKNEARRLLASEIAELAAAGVAPFVRINPFSETTVADLDAAVCAGLAGIMMPKTETVQQVRALHDMLSYREGLRGIPHGTVAIMALPETARGLQDAELLAAASTRVKGICGVVGGPVVADVATAFGFVPSMGGIEQLYMNSKLVLDSRAAGAPFPIAGIIGTALDDLEAVELLVRRARSLGYTGCPVMHPSHVAVVQKVFMPTLEEAEYYEGLLAAFAVAEAEGKGAVNYKGMMIDYAMLPLARQVVSEYKRRAARVAA